MQMMILKHEGRDDVLVPRASAASVSGSSSPGDSDKLVLIELQDQDGEVFAVAPFTAEGAIRFAAKLGALGKVLLGRLS